MESRTYRVMDIKGKVSPVIEEDHLYALARGGFILPNTKICDVGQGAWTFASDHAGLRAIFKTLHPHLYPDTSAPILKPAPYHRTSTVDSEAKTISAHVRPDPAAQRYMATVYIAAGCFLAFIGVCLFGFVSLSHRLEAPPRPVVIVSQTPKESPVSTAVSPAPVTQSPADPPESTPSARSYSPVPEAPTGTRLRYLPYPGPDGKTRWVQVPVDARPTEYYPFPGVPGPKHSQPLPGFPSLRDASAAVSRLAQPKASLPSGRVYYPPKVAPVTPHFETNYFEPPHDPPAATEPAEAPAINSGGNGFRMSPQGGAGIASAASTSDDPVPAQPTARRARTVRPNYSNSRVFTPSRPAYTTFNAPKVNGGAWVNGRNKFTTYPNGFVSGGARGGR